MHAPQVFALPDIVFVTQIPNPGDFGTSNAALGNHLSTLASIPRGGDLWIRYADGTLKNLTKAAGLGVDGFQGANCIAVRDPAAHWDGARVLFSMVIGCPEQRYKLEEYRWQIYEMTNLSKSQTPVVTKVANQPTQYNNVMATYGTDDRIIFISDRPRGGETHLYPQKDEYESFATNTGIWSLDPATGSLTILDHAPSGDFDPFIDSFGRIIFTRWDHLQRDQQGDNPLDNSYGAFDYPSESSTTPTSERVEVFPEVRSQNAPIDPRINRHSFNHFFPWQLNEDGTEHETVNHIGRHELHGYFNKSRNDDKGEVDFSGVYRRTLQLNNIHQMSEDPSVPGLFVGIDCPEFGTHASGQVVTLTGAPDINPDLMDVTYLTPRSTSSSSDNPPPDHSGLYRDPLPLGNQQYVVAHTTATAQDSNVGSTESPLSRYAYRLRTLTKQGDYFVPDQYLTSGISKAVSWYDPDTLKSYNGALWELQPIALTMRSRPARRASQIPSIEQTIFDEEGVSLPALQQKLKERGEALIISRNITTRDQADKQQPFNLQVRDTTTKTATQTGTLFRVNEMQIVQGDLVRGYSRNNQPSPGRRVLPRFLHDSLQLNEPIAGSQEGSVKIADDGSVAAIVPAQRALSWQLLSPEGEPVVRERYWLTFQPGEVRVCASCHGVNHYDQTGKTAPTNPPEALRLLLRSLRDGIPTPTAPTPTPPSSPKITMTVQQTTRNTRKPGEQVYLLSINQESAKTRILNLSASVAGTPCAPSPLRQLTVRDRRTEFFLHLTSTRKATSISLSLIEQGTIVAERTLSLRAKHGSNGKSKYRRQNVCHELGKLRQNHPEGQHYSHSSS